MKDNIPTEEMAEVVSVNGDSVKFTLKIGSTCKECGLYGFCANNGKDNIHKTISNLNLSKGDLIRVTLEPGKKIFLSFIIFIFPLIILILTYIIGANVLLLSELNSIILSFCSLLFSGFVIYRVDKAFGDKVKFKIMEKLDEDIS